MALGYPHSLHWLLSNLEEREADNFLSLRDIYPQYFAFCASRSVVAMSENIFGRYISALFPSAIPWRRSIDNTRTIMYEKLYYRESLPLSHQLEFPDYCITEKTKDGFSVQMPVCYKNAETMWTNESIKVEFASNGKVAIKFRGKTLNPLNLGLTDVFDGTNESAHVWMHQVSILHACRGIQVERSKLTELQKFPHLFVIRQDLMNDFRVNYSSCTSFIGVISRRDYCLECHRRVHQYLCKSQAVKEENARLQNENEQNLTVAASVGRKVRPKSTSGKGKKRARSLTANRNIGKRVKSSTAKTNIQKAAEYKPRSPTSTITSRKVGQKRKEPYKLATLCTATPTITDHNYTYSTQSTASQLCASAPTKSTTTPTVENQPRNETEEEEEEPSYNGIIQTESETIDVAEILNKVLPHADPVAKQFLCEQIVQLSKDEPDRQWGPQTMRICQSVYAISPEAYKSFRDASKLPLPPGQILQTRKN